MRDNNRKRQRRGETKSFYDLPIEAQQKFISIKNYINEHIGKSIDVYLYGSYYWGHWDELSNYDVIVKEDINTIEISQLILNELNIDNNIIYSNEFNKTSTLIP